MATSKRIGDYLIEQLYAHGVGHVFGLAGDYALTFFDLMARHEKLSLINTCDEQGAGFAADAYARLRGLGAVCVTYGVGGLKVANTTAQAYAEKSPVVEISGAPGMDERENNPLLHHKVKEFDTQKRVFDEFTVASALLDNPETAFQEIDRVIHAALRYKRPVYLELPRDMVLKEGLGHHVHEPSAEKSDPDTLGEALEEAVSLINAAERPVILAGMEIQRFGLQNLLIDLALIIAWNASVFAQGERPLFFMGEDNVFPYSFKEDGEMKGTDYDLVVEAAGWAKRSVPITMPVVQSQFHPVGVNNKNRSRSPVSFAAQRSASILFVQLLPDLIIGLARREGPSFQ